MIKEQVGGKKRRKKEGGVGGESWKRRRCLAPPPPQSWKKWERTKWGRREDGLRERGGKKNKLWVHTLQHEDSVRTLLKMKLEQWVKCKFYFEKEGIRFKVQCFLKTYTYINSLFSNIEYKTRTQVNIKSYVQEQWRFHSEEIWWQAVPVVSFAVVKITCKEQTGNKLNKITSRNNPILYNIKGRATNFNSDENMEYSLNIVTSGKSIHIIFSLLH